MINVERMLAEAQQALGWPYVSPGTNDKNGIDCSGLFVRLFRSQGGVIAHGSNTIWRKYTTDEKGRLISAAAVLRPGAAVFKWRSQTPEKFGDGLGDFHHIGLVISADPVRIIHASSAKGQVVIDTSALAWTHYAFLKGVDYMPEIKETVTASAPDGGSINIRAGASTRAGIVDRIASGSVLEVLERGQEWSRVRLVTGRTGYIMSKFLTCQQSAGDYVTRAEFDKAIEELKKLIKGGAQNGD